MSNELSITPEELRSAREEIQLVKDNLRKMRAEMRLMLDELPPAAGKQPSEDPETELRHTMNKLLRTLVDFRQTREELRRMLEERR